MAAFALSFVMLMLWRIFFVKEPPPPPPKKTPPASASAVKPVTPPANPPRPSRKAAGKIPAGLPVAEGSKAEDIVVESNRYRVTFSTAGAVVKSWVLKGYPKGDRVDVVDANACEKLGFPMSLRLPDPALAAQLNSAIYVVEADRTVPGGEPEKLTGSSFAAPVTLTFAYSNGKIQARKRFSFGNSYTIPAEISASDVERSLPVEVAWPGGFGDQSLAPAQRAALERAVYETADNSKVREVTLTPSFLSHFTGGGTNETQQDVPGPLTFAGLEDRFFAGIFLIDSPDARLSITREVWTPPNWQGEEKDKPKPLAISLENPNGKPLSFRLFVAPKDVDVLRTAVPPLDSLVDFGWFSINLPSRSSWVCASSTITWCTTTAGPSFCLRSSSTWPPSPCGCAAFVPRRKCSAWHRSSKASRTSTRPIISTIPASRK